MNIHTAWEKRDKLSDKDLRLLLQALEVHLVNYRAAIANYPPRRMELYGRPYLDGLTSKIETVQGMIK